jgi:hypothetical protein
VGHARWLERLQGPLSAEQLAASRRSSTRSGCDGRSRRGSE